MKLGKSCSTNWYFLSILLGELANQVTVERYVDAVNMKLFMVSQSCLLIVLILNEPTHSHPFTLNSIIFGDVIKQFLHEFTENDKHHNFIHCNRGLHGLFFIIVGYCLDHHITLLIINRHGIHYTCSTFGSIIMLDFSTSNFNTLWYPRLIREKSMSIVCTNLTRTCNFIGVFVTSILPKLHYSIFLNNSKQSKYQKSDF